jgi:hypothetical protein
MESGYFSLRAFLLKTKPGVDVMITNFGDFHQFSAKILASLLKTNAMIQFCKK